MNEQGTILSPEIQELPFGAMIHVYVRMECNFVFMGFNDIISGLFASCAMISHYFVDI